MLIPPHITLNYERPSQVREIPLKATSYRGQFISNKLQFLNNEKKIIEYESGLERDFYYLLDHDYYCYDFQPQPLALHWIDRENNEHIFYPDCWALFIDGKQVLFEVKSISKLKKSENDELWKQELEAIQNYCQNHQWEFRIVTEYDILIPRLSNIVALRGAVQHPPEEKDIENSLNILLKAFSKGIGQIYPQIIDLLSKKQDIHIQSARHIVQYLLYYQILSFDWNKLLTNNTLIFLDLEHISLAEPIYKIRPLEVDKSIINSNLFSDSISFENDIASIEPELIEEANQRYEIIKNLIENPERTEEDVRKKASEIGKTARTLYNWIKAYENGHWRSLLRKDDKKGNRESRYPSEVEEIIQNSIKKHLDTFSSVKACWIDIVTECEKIGVNKPPSYETIKKRIRKLPAKERKGKQGGYIRYEIQQSVMGELPTGQKPLDLIQMDHTLLDIVLVDQVYHKPIGRPWLTLAIDTYSRMIYGYFLSFSNPSSLSVTATLMNGILPKDELLKLFNIEAPYPIYGLPKRIQIDNSREFRSKHLELFCQMYTIDLEFRPVRRPDKGSYIERLFGTINRTIRDERLPGYAPPLKNRPKDYNPDNVAEKNGLTLLEFEKWFLLFITKTYHQRTHNTLEKSPLEQYQLGIMGIGDSLGGNPILPRDIIKLKFDILPISSKEVSIQSYGIRWVGNNYNSPILAELRRSQQGKQKKVRFRYNPLDIRQIWTYNKEEQKYYSIPLTRGKLLLFLKRNPELSISLSEYKTIKKELKEKKKQNDSVLVDEGMQERRELLKQSQKTSKRARRELAKGERNLILSSTNIERSSNTAIGYDDTKLDDTNKNQDSSKRAEQITKPTTASPSQVYDDSKPVEAFETDTKKIQEKFSKKYHHE